MEAQPSRLTIDPVAERHFRIAGVIDLHTSTELTDHLDSAGAEADLRLELDAVEFIDSSGLRSLVLAHERFTEADHRLELGGISESVRRLLEITGLHDHFHLV